MSKELFTPGPWTSDWGDMSPYPQDAMRGTYLVIKGSGGEHIATVFETDPEEPVTSDLRDGSLIAAAPDLYGACEAALSLCEANGYGLDATPERKSVQELLRSALAKATHR